MSTPSMEEIERTRLAVREECERVARRCIEIIKKYQHELTIIERIREEFGL